MLDFEELVAEIPVHVYWLDRHNVYQGCNDIQAKSFSLVSRHEIIGKRNADLLTMTEEIADICNQNNLKVMETGEAVLVEEPIMWPDGRLGVVLTCKRPWFDKKTQAVIGLIGISLDFSKYKEQEAALERAIEHTQLSLDFIISQMPAHVYWKNKEGIYLGCNDLQARNLGFNSSSEIIDKTDFDISKDELAAKKFFDNDRRVMEQTEHEVVEEEIDLSGERRIVLSSKTALKNTKGEVIGLVGISFDITDRKQMEAALVEAKEVAETANHAKTEFIENMRHDIRTPLCGIVSFSEILERETDRNKIKEYAVYLRKSGKELLHFLNEVLDSMNVASGEIPLVQKRFSLREVLEKVIDLHRAMAADKKLAMNFHFDEAIPKYLIGDPLRIYRIILELLSNALKFTSEGQVNIYAQWLRKESDTRHHTIQIVIEDTGIGIAEDKQQELFVRFKRLTPSYQGIYKGTGLGLSIAKQFLDELEAEIYIESALGKGTRLTCAFDFREALLTEELQSTVVLKKSGALVALQKNVATTIAPSFSVQEPICVLIVEDEPIAAMVVRVILEELGCIVDIATNGESAIELSMSNNYNLIFMDIGLPDIDGYETTLRIRAAEAQRMQAEQSHRSFIVGLTGHADPDRKRRGLDVGMNVVLTKPLSRDQAVSLLEMIVGKSAIVEGSR